jgi:hypothetical protein
MPKWDEIIFLFFVQLFFGLNLFVFFFFFFFFFWLSNREFHFSIKNSKFKYILNFNFLLIIEFFNDGFQ